MTEGLKDSHVPWIWIRDLDPDQIRNPDPQLEKMLDQDPHPDPH